MEQEYVLDWLDRTVYELHPLRNESFDHHRSLMVIKKAEEEKGRSITYLKQVIFRQIKKDRARKIVEAYFNTVTSLIENAETQLRLIPIEVLHLRSALAVVLSCLDEVLAFIVERYPTFLNPDKPIKKIPRAISYVEFPHKELGKLLPDYPQLYNMLCAEHESVFGEKQTGFITLRQVSYWKTLVESLRSCKSSGPSPEHFCNVEMILIERNFNSPDFVKYITVRMLDVVAAIDTEPARLNHLTYLLKSFHQIPAVKEMVYFAQYDDLRATVGDWLRHEIEYRSKIVTMATTSYSVPSKSDKYIRKHTGKVMCMLTVDQLALFFKAADQAKIITARSLSAIFSAIAPHLSTPHKEDISQGSLRTKSYSVEQRDKEMVLEVIDKLARHIEDL